MAFGGTMAAQKGPLWWAAHHRNHHQFADTERDTHSPQRGFWWSHVGWILCDKFGASRHDKIRDFAKYPELRFLDKHDWIGPWTLGVVCYLIGGWSGLLIGFFASTVLLWHATFTVNSLAHVFGRRVYDTPDTSRNTLLVAIATGGEGWHNNHHRYPFSARQGFHWWQIDTTYYVLRGSACSASCAISGRYPPRSSRRQRLADVRSFRGGRVTELLAQEVRGVGVVVEALDGLEPVLGVQRERLRERAVGVESERLVAERATLRHEL